MAPNKRFHSFKKTIKIRGPGISKTKKIFFSLLSPALVSTQENSSNSNAVSINNNLSDNETDLQAEKSGSSEICSQPSITSYLKRKLKEDDDWEKVREKLKLVFIENQFLASDALCTICIKNNQVPPRKAVSRCEDCGWQQYFCLECATSHHSSCNMFHVLQLWKDGKFVPMFPNNQLIIPNGHEHCYSFLQNVKSIVFIDLQGRQHLKKVVFCSCQSEAETLVSVGFWPGSANKPVTAFDMRLLNMLSDLLLECHCSLDKLCATISLWNGSLLPTYIKSIYKILNNSSFEEYRFFRHSIEIQVEKCTLCPKPNSNGVLIECMDACFGFVRKKTAGSSFNNPKYKSLLFADQDDVDNFIEAHSKEIKKSDNNCSQYRAGEIIENIRSKGRNEKYDEKGVFGRICRHGFPKGFVNLKHGERISYAVYELKRMIEPYVGSTNIEIKCMYDIACILHNHLQNNNCYNLGSCLDKVQFGIPIFHAYVHISKCQMTYSPRRVKGFGLTDGEGIERMWSYLRKFCYMTKEMTASRRTDLLTEALLHYAQRVSRNQGRYLECNLKKTKILKEKSLAELQELTGKLPSEIIVTDSLVEEWKREQIELLEAKKVSCYTTSSWEVDYARLLWDHFQLRNSIASSQLNGKNHRDLITKACRLDERLSKIERKNNVKERWKNSNPTFILGVKVVEEERRDSILMKLHSLSMERHLKLMLKDRYSVGQKQAIRLAQRVNQQTKKMKIELSKYNAQLSLIKEHVDLALEPLTFESVKDPNSKIFYKFATRTLSQQISFDIKSRIIELKELLLRCEEERSLLQTECQSLLDSKLELLSVLTQKCEVLSFNIDNYSKGLSALLKNKLMQVEHEIDTDKNVYEKFGIKLPIALSAPQCEYLGSINTNVILPSESNQSDSEESLELSNSESSDSESDYNFCTNY